ncbi:MAG: metal/formaldehyde-sensitive transcriptional repressor [Candidatus Pacebacteria bacterium]|nr:metal/formaldehyde-sensitive transcriptional repressor [Candidatus Paceibacterota bacterium]
MLDPRHKKKLLQRISRIRGQLNGVENMLAQDRHTFKILQNAAACRGALNGLMAEIIEAHIHQLSDTGSQKQKESASELIDIVHAYLK